MQSAIPDTKNTYVIAFNCHTERVCEELLERIEDKPMSKFKTGDKVICIKGPSKGREATVGIVYCSESMRLKGEVGIFNTSFWEKVEDKDMSYLKEGCKVIITDGNWSGEIATFLEMVSPDICCVEFRNGTKRPILIRFVSYYDTTYTIKPHKHRDLIIAWANGAEIESLHFQGGWSPCPSPKWEIHVEYRIKPQKSEKDLEIEAIQSEMGKLQERLDKLKG